jgi:hypothetical protein
VKGIDHVSYTSSQVARLDKLWQIVIKSREICERCGRPATDAAHIIRKSGGRFNTRWRVENGLMLCRNCHHFLDSSPRHMADFVDTLHGVGTYDSLHALSNGDSTRTVREIADGLEGGVS